MSRINFEDLLSYAENNESKTPEHSLFDAIENNESIETIEDLLKNNNIDFRATNQDNRTPIMLAARIKPQERAIEISNLLINYGGKVQICTFRQENEQYISSVQEAQEVGNEQTAMFLLGQIFND
jgi:uncharacterized membrane protein YgaE (UPF0421/DUF939 family)